MKKFGKPRKSKASQSGGFVEGSLNKEAFNKKIDSLWMPYVLRQTVVLNTRDIDPFESEKISHLFELSDYVALVFARFDSNVDVKSMRSDLLKVMLTHSKYYFIVAHLMVGVHLIEGTAKEILEIEFEDVSQMGIRRALSAAHEEYLLRRLQRKVDSFYF